MPPYRFIATIYCVVFFMPAWAVNGMDISGRWEVTTEYPGGEFVAGLDLNDDGGQLTGRSGNLIPDRTPFYYTGTFERGRARLAIRSKDASVIGELTLREVRGKLQGQGTIRGIAAKLVGQRPAPRPPTSVIHDYEPSVYYRLFSGAIAPVLRIFPGDSVRTKTVDSSGFDENNVSRSLPGNPVTGPFYVEGAMPGDTIAVHLRKIRLNRDTARQYHATLVPSVLPPGYQQRGQDSWGATWHLDVATATGTPDMASEKLRNYEVHLIPMLGCIGVAPFFNLAQDTADLGAYGGNLDYNQLVEGVTLYLPVYQAGALLSLGDGHALQADGEVAGAGLETSLNVEFSVDLLPNESFGAPWAENDRYIMTSGIGGSLDDALQNATGQLSNWLKVYYELNTSEISTLFAGSIQYDIAEVVDPKFHVVAKISKEVLHRIPQSMRKQDVYCITPAVCYLN